MKQSDFPEWAQRVKEQYKGTQLRKIGSNIYLYAVSSRRVPGKSYPVLTQSYMGIVTPSGLIEPQSFQFRPLESDAVLFAVLPGISEIAFTSLHDPERGHLVLSETHQTGRGDSPPSEPDLPHRVLQPLIFLSFL